MWFANDFHSWLRHSWKLLANRLTRDPKIVVHGNSCIILYISINHDRFRTALSICRTSSHNLEVERGRHTNTVTPLERRLCLMCHEIEDRINFTSRCQMYKTGRLDLFTKVRNKLWISVHLMIPKNSQSSISFFLPQACIQWTCLC